MLRFDLCPDRLTCQLRCEALYPIAHPSEFLFCHKFFLAFQAKDILKVWYYCSHVWFILFWTTPNDIGSCSVEMVIVSYSCSHFSIGKVLRFLSSRDSVRCLAFMCMFPWNNADLMLLCIIWQYMYGSYSSIWFRERFPWKMRTIVPGEICY